MAGTQFKMKGSPMQRNFGVGSPVKQKMIRTGPRINTQTGTTIGPSDRYGFRSEKGRVSFIGQSGGRTITKGGGHFSPKDIRKAATGSTKFLSKLGKFFGGKTLGVLGMLGSTSASADQPGTGTHGGKKVAKLRELR